MKRASSAPAKRTAAAKKPAKKPVTPTKPQAKTTTKTSTKAAPKTTAKAAQKPAPKGAAKGAASKPQKASAKPAPPPAKKTAAAAKTSAKGPAKTSSKPTMTADVAKAEAPPAAAAAAPEPKRPTVPPKAAKAPAKPEPPKKPKKADLTPKELARIKAELGELREQYEKEYRDLEEGTLAMSQSEMSGETTFDEEYADAGSFTFEREKEMSIGNNIRDLLEKVQHALASIERGTYGICENCGDPIDKNRLLALPYSALCIKCKTQEERLR